MKWLMPSRTLSWKIVVVAFFVILGIGTWYAYGHLIIDTNLAGIRFLEGPYPHRTLYEFTATTTVPVVVPVQGIVIDDARGGGVEVVETVNAQGLQQVVLLGTEPRTLISTSPLPLGALALSPDGKTLAYAVNALTATSTDPSDFYAFGAWGVETMDIGTGSTTPRGVGYAPQFFERDGRLYLFYTKVGGVAIVDLESGRTYTLPLNIPNSIFPAAISSDGSFLVYSQLPTARYVLAPVVSITPLALGTVTPLAREPYRVVFNGKTLLGTVASGEGRSTLYAWSVEHPSFSLALRTVSVTALYRLMTP